MNGTAFNARLTARCAQVRNSVCVGIDPSPEALRLVHDSGAKDSPLDRFCDLLIASAAHSAAAVKFQVAWFETHGAVGMASLERAIAAARRTGLLVIADAKRGDVPHSARAYAEAWLDPSSPFACDALTVNASIGDDALTAMGEVARACNAQLYALVLTSNPGAATLQQLTLDDGRMWCQALAALIDRVGCGAVVGATQTTVLATLRSAMPHAPLLVPGIGAQGGSVSDLAALRSPTAPPVLVAASRSLLPADQRDDATFADHVTSQVRKLAQSAGEIMHVTPPAGVISRP